MAELRGISKPMGSIALWPMAGGDSFRLAALTVKAQADLAEVDLLHSDKARIFKAVVAYPAALDRLRLGRFGA